MIGYSFHPEALLEYAEATHYYLNEASARVAEAFVGRVESAVRDLREAPGRWSVVEEPGIRRYVLKGFPYVLYYRLEGETEPIVIYAVMHCSREPGYWKHRVA